MLALVGCFFSRADRGERDITIESNLPRMSTAQAWLQSYLTLIWFALAVVIAWLLYTYTNHNLVTFRPFYLAVYVAYGAGFGIIVAAPIDVAYTLRARDVKPRLIDDYDVCMAHSPPSCAPLLPSSLSDRIGPTANPTGPSDRASVNFCDH